MANKTFHIPQTDEGLWAAAQRVANRRRISLYQLVAESLDAHLPHAAQQPAPEDRWSHIAADVA